MVVVVLLDFRDYNYVFAATASLLFFETDEDAESEP